MALAAIAFGAALVFAAPAFATEIVIDTNATVQKGACEYCHADIADTKNYSKEIIFAHGLHVLIPCQSCHSQFPHGKSGTSVPTMKVCFQCHGLRHGPMGVLATGECKDCHVTPREQLRPSFHTADWKYKPHVEPGRTELQTKCMMCHTQADCDNCHAQEGISWQPNVPYTYDPKDGCQACHGNPLLQKASANNTTHSYQVSGLDTSAHRNLSCIQCHPDFKYDDTPDATRLWDVNAGKACQNCHEHDKTAATYANSIHGKELAKGNVNTATCASCHGGHDIQLLTESKGGTQAARDALHASAYAVCARCHKDKYDSYDDYYHGRAYKEGSADAPACWDCHGAHDTLPTADTASHTSAKNVANTCGGDIATNGLSCHKGSAETFGAKAEKLIHQKREVRENNALAKLISKVKGWFGA